MMCVGIMGPGAGRCGAGTIRGLTSIWVLATITLGRHERTETDAGLEDNPEGYIDTPRPVWQRRRRYEGERKDAAALRNRRPKACVRALISQGQLK